MSTLVFKLRYVPDDEAEAVRAVLATHRIEFYETTAGNWGIAMPGIWVPDEDVQQARKLIDDYQQTRADERRSEHEADTARGTAPLWYDQFVKRPLATMGIVLFCLFLLYALLSPFLRLAVSS